jgi:hypothetical protein
MPTQEERLAAVEKFTQVASGHIRDTEENVTILLGVIRSQGHDIRRLVEQGEQYTSLLHQHTALLNEHTELLKQILARLPAPGQT